MTRSKLLGAMLAATLALSGCQTALDRVNGRLLPDLHEAMTAEDARRAALALNQALENHAADETVEWSNAGTGVSGSFTPTRTFQTETGRFCRDFKEVLEIAEDRRASYRLTACRNFQGVWLVQ